MDSGESRFAAPPPSEEGFAEPGGLLANDAAPEGSRATVRPRHHVLWRTTGAFMGVLSCLMIALGIWGRITSSYGLRQVERRSAELSLFCWALMFPQEVDLIRVQIARSVSVFSCNVGVVVSSVTFPLGKIAGQPVYAWVPSQPLTESQFKGHYFNTKNFIIAWDTVVKSGVWKAHSWIVKGDPDCVFFADRLRPRISMYTGQKVYFRNCNKFGPKLWGPVEVFSKEAIQQYEWQKGECESQPWSYLAEDEYMDKSMVDVLHAQPVEDWGMLATEGCSSSWTNCGDGSRAAFHPFKDKLSFENCLKQATR